MCFKEREKGATIDEQQQQRQKQRRCEMKTDKRVFEAFLIKSPSSLCCLLCQRWSCYCFNQRST
jgi:hypothetical protein